MRNFWLYILPYKLVVWYCKKYIERFAIHEMLIQSGYIIYLSENPNEGIIVPKIH